MICWYGGVCPKRREGCERGCAKFTQVSHLFIQSRMPEAMRKPLALVPDDVDVPAFDRLMEIKKSIVEFVSGGGNLYITSAVTGNGKTTWAVKLMQAYFDKVWPGNNFRERGVFISMPELLAMYSRLHSDEASSDDVAELTDVICRVDLVVWDDIGATRLTESQQNYVQGLLDRRLNGGLSNVFTGNMVDAPLVSAVGARIFSRVQTNSEVVVLKGRDMRGTVADTM